MKGGDCKLPIPEDHRSFLNKQKFAYSGSKKFAIIAAFLLLIAMSLMTVFTFQSINGISELRQEVDYLKSAIQALQKKINEDPDRDAINLPKVPKNDDHNDSSDANYVDYEYEPDMDYNDDPDNYYDDTDNDGEYDNNDAPLTGEQFTKDAKKATIPPRTKRSIIGYTQDGTPINSDGSSEERRRSTSHRKHYFSTPPSSYSYPFYPELSTDPDVPSTTPSSRTLHSRRLRVYQDDNSQEFRQRLKTTPLLKSGDSHNSEESQDDYFSAVGGEQHGTRHRQRRLELEDRHVRIGRMRPLPAAHFSGDTSRYVFGQHANFNGNGHMRHPRVTYEDWVPSSWFHSLGMDRHFSLSNGTLTIKESGLYFIYAQIFYLDVHDMNGFRVYKNENEIVLQCTTMTHTVTTVMKGNTCFTAGVEYLNENDGISLADLSEDRYSMFENGKSFFGVIKLGDVKIK